VEVGFEGLARMVDGGSFSDKARQGDPLSVTG
jgi:hypothetical protein